MNDATTKRTRAERKKARNESFARMEQIRQQQIVQRNMWAMQHPVSAGLVPVVDYVAPR